METVLGDLHTMFGRVLSGLGMRLSLRFFISAGPISIFPGPKGGDPLGKWDLEPF